MTEPKHPHWPPEQRSARDVLLPFRLHPQRNIFLRRRQLALSPWQLWTSEGLARADRQELSLCLPPDWPYWPDTSPPTLEVFPLLLLRRLVARLLRKNSRWRPSDGLWLGRTETAWADLPWPEGWRGLLLLSREGRWLPLALNGEEEEQWRAAPAAWREERRQRAWAELAWPLPTQILLQSQLNRAVALNQLAQVRKLLAAGARADYPFYQNGPMGPLVAGTLLERARRDGRLVLAELLEETGTK